MPDYIDFQIFNMYVARFKILKERLRDEKMDDGKFKRLTNRANETWTTINEFMDHYDDHGFINTYLELKTIVSKELHEFI